MDDHFVHGSLIPPAEAPASRRGPVVFAAVVVLILGILVAIFWRELLSLPSSFSPRSSGEAAEQASPTAEEKARLLESAVETSSTAPPPVSAGAKTTLLEEGSTGAVSAPDSAISAEEKAKLLGGE